MKLRELCEEFKDGIKKYGKYYEIYKNPSHDELRDMYKKMITPIRYIYDKKKEDLYVFDSDLLHMTVAEKLGFRYLLPSEDYIFGIGLLTTNGRIIDSNSFGSGGVFKGTKVEHLFVDK